MPHFSLKGLSGHIPDWIRNRASVRSISLAENMFSGPLPLQHLVSFSAETNQLSGSIPAEICQANSLQSLILHNNNLTWSIIETFKGCKNLTELNLLGNRLNGEIPDYLAELPLVKQELSQNNFTGMLPCGSHQPFWRSVGVHRFELSLPSISEWLFD